MLVGVCFYLMAAGEMRERFGWSNILTNSAKLANIIARLSLSSDLSPHGGLRRGGRQGAARMSVVSPAVAMITLRGPAGFGPAVEGEALVSTDAFSPRYDLDRDAGIVSRRDHAIAGSSIKGKVLVIPAAKGGVAAGWAFYDIAQRGIAPLALICPKPTR